MAGYSLGSAKGYQDGKARVFASLNTGELAVSMAPDQMFGKVNLIMHLYCYIIVGCKIFSGSIFRDFHIMNKINVALVRLFQFVVFVFFTFMVLAYFGAMILVPLDLVVLIIKVLDVAGLGGMIGAGVAVAVVGYLGMVVYKTPGLVNMIVEIGLDLIKKGKERVEAFNAIVESVKR